MTTRIYGVARFAIWPAETAEFIALATRLLVLPTRQEAGCDRYQRVQNIDDPSRFALLETWISAADLATHLAQPGQGAALDELRPLIAPPPLVEKFCDTVD